MCTCCYHFVETPAIATVCHNVTNQVDTETRPHGIFGVPLRQSITYANVAISLVDDDGKSYIYGYVPIVVAKCGVFLKEKGSSPTTPVFVPEK